VCVLTETCGDTNGNALRCWLCTTYSCVYFHVNGRERQFCMRILLYDKHCNVDAMWNVLQLFDCSFDSFQNCCPHVLNCLEGDVTTHLLDKNNKIT